MLFTPMKYNIFFLLILRSWWVVTVKGYTIMYLYLSLFCVNIENYSRIICIIGFQYYINNISNTIHLHHSYKWEQSV